MVEERLVHLVEQLWIDCLRERDAGDLHTECGMQRLHLEGPVARLMFALGLSHRSPPVLFVDVTAP